jgi:hypothetical protein
MVTDLPLRRLLLVLVAFAGYGLRAHAQPCDEQWLPGYGHPGVSGVVHASVLWDPDGPGPEGRWLVVGGDFQQAGDLTCGSIARWNPATGQWVSPG